MNYIRRIYLNYCQCQNLGIESKFNKRLKGINGYYKYQKDSEGYKIPDTPEEKEDGVNFSRGR